MDKKSKVLITIFLILLVGSIAYAQYRFILKKDFLIDESQVETEGAEELSDESSFVEDMPEGQSEGGE